MNKIPLIFMGSPAVAVTILKALLEANYEISAVVTQPDKPAGRGQKLTPPPVKIFAQEKGLKILQPTKVKTPEFIEELKQYPAKALIVAAYGRILSQEIIDLTPYPLNVHFSLLPKYRGASCVAQAILNGDTKTGVTIMKIVEALDAGPIFAQEKLLIQDNDNTGFVEEALAQKGGVLLVKTLQNLEKLHPQEQKAEEASYAPLIKKENAQIQWNKTASEIHNQIRAFNPWPIAYTFIDNQRLKIYSSAIKASEKLSEKPGTVIKIDSHGIEVVCGKGSLEIIELQAEGKKRMSALDFMQGWKEKLTPGKVFS